MSGFIQGHHVFKNIWVPVKGEVLCCVREPENTHDKNAVAVKKSKEGITVGHIPKNLFPAVSSFLTNDVNKAVCKVTGKRLNRGAGMGLEVPCMYKFVGQESSIESLRTAIYRCSETGTGCK